MRLTIAQTLQHYEKTNLPKDICAGIIIMAVSIPISMGYAQIAGLPAVYGLYGSVFPILLFALFSTSPQFIFGVDAAPAALIGGALIDLHIESGSEAALKVVPVLTLFVAVWLLAFYLMKAGKLVNYISAPVMGGWSTYDKVSSGQGVGHTDIKCCADGTSAVEGGGSVCSAA